MKFVNTKEFNELKKSGKLILVDFYADWCGPCKMLTPVLTEIGSERSDVEIVKIDVDKEGVLAQSLGIMSIPSLFLFKDDKIVAKTIGYQGKAAINAFINKGL
jgi:thioredoxin 1